MQVILKEVEFESLAAARMTWEERENSKESKAILIFLIWLTALIIVPFIEIGHEVGR